MAIDGAEVPRGPSEALRLLGRGPFVPDRDALLLERRDVRVAADEPQKLVEDRAKVHLLRREKREAGLQIEPHLMPEDGAGASAGAIFSIDPRLQDPAQEVEILALSAHDLSAFRSAFDPPRHSGDSGTTASLVHSAGVRETTASACTPPLSSSARIS